LEFYHKPMMLSPATQLAQKSRLTHFERIGVTGFVTRRHTVQLMANHNPVVRLAHY